MYNNSRMYINKVKKMINDSDKKPRKKKENELFEKKTKPKKTKKKYVYKKSNKK